MWTTIEIYHKHKLKQGIELALDKPKSRIQILSYAQLFQIPFPQCSKI
jgi:hypothetical protein